MNQTPDKLWLDILAELDDSADSDVYLRQVTPRTLTEDSFIIAVPSTYTQAEIENRYLKNIDKLLANRMGVDCTLKFAVEPPLENETATEEPKDPSQNGSPESASLNPNYVFDNFKVGQSNRICHATAYSVSDDPGGEYNPLFIYGGVGLGKTHLLHAIGNRVQEKTPDCKVLYVTSETFMNEYIESIVNRTSAQDFRNKYRKTDLLLIDDIQFLQRKEGTQEEFFNTFNDLYLNSGQIVLSSDRSPSMLENLEERLSSRFEWGMVAEIDKPNYELRLAILRSKCQEQGLDDISDEVLNYIAEIVTSNIRQLEGTLLRLNTQASFLGEKLDLDFARAALNDTSTRSGSRRKAVTAAAIQKIVTDHFHLDSDDLISARRTKAIAFPRQVAMYLCRELTQLSLLDIAEAFHRQNHTTVIHACTQIEKLSIEDEEAKKLINMLMDELT